MTCVATLSALYLAEMLHQLDHQLCTVCNASQLHPVQYHIHTAYMLMIKELSSHHMVLFTIILLRYSAEEVK